MPLLRTIQKYPCSRSGRHAQGGQRHYEWEGVSPGLTDSSQNAISQHAISQLASSFAPVGLSVCSPHPRQVKKTLASSHFKDFKEETGTSKIGRMLLEARAFMYMQMADLSRTAALDALETARDIEIGTGDDYETGLIGRSVEVLKHDRTFEEFEEETYESLMSQLTEFAKQSQPDDVEGGIFVSHGSAATMSRYEDKRKRECLLMSLVYADAKK